jgi:hypothetical protein
MPDVLLGILGGIGAILIGIGTAMAASVTTTSGFMIARVCLVAGFFLVLVSAVYWAWTYPSWTVLTKAIWLTIFGALSFSPLFLTISWVNDQEIGRRPRLFAGITSDPPGFDNCKIPANAFKVFLGSNLSWSVSFPRTVLRMHEDPMLVIDKDNKGRLVISLLRIFNEQDDQLVRFDNGEYWATPAIRVQRPDKSTLVAYGKSDKEILYISYLNPRSVLIRGIFLHPPTLPIIVDNEAIKGGGRIITNSCMQSSDADIAF